MPAQNEPCHNGHSDFYYRLINLNVKEEVHMLRMGESVMTFNRMVDSDVNLQQLARFQVL